MLFININMNILIVKLIQYNILFNNERFLNWI